MALLTQERVDPRVNDAWRAYLEAVRDARLRGALSVDEVEEWAWARLQQQLRTIDKQPR